MEAGKPCPMQQFCLSTDFGLLLSHFMDKGDFVVTTIHLANTHLSPARPAPSTERRFPTSFVCPTGHRPKPPVHSNVNLLRNQHRPENKSRESRITSEHLDFLAWGDFSGLYANIFQSWSDLPSPASPFRLPSDFL